MYIKDPTDMSPTGSAVKLQGVTKTFTQWQRDNSRKNILQNLIRPEKRLITALAGVDLYVGKGEFVAYAGPNGAGKSTTMKLLSGMLLPNEGHIEVLGLSPQKQRVLLMKKLGVLFGNRTELWWDHPVIQSFEWKRVIWDIPKAQYQKNLALLTDLLDIGNLLKTFARELSLGQRMRADLALMLLHSPQLILLDEPTLGLDVVAKRQMIDFLKQINREEGVTILVTSHDMDDLEEMARRVVLVSGGRLAYDGSFDGLRKITGSRTQICVETSGQTTPAIRCGRPISWENGRATYEIDREITPVRAFLQELSRLDNIEDIQIQKPPIEQVIAELYQHWKTP